MCSGTVGTEHVRVNAILPSLGISPIEILLITAATMLAVVRWLPTRARRPTALAAVAVLTGSGAALGAFGVRWQMIPVLRRRFTW